MPVAVVYGRSSSRTTLRRRSSSGIDADRAGDDVDQPARAPTVSNSHGPRYAPRPHGVGEHRDVLEPTSSVPGTGRGRHAANTGALVAGDRVGRRTSRHRQIVDARRREAARRRRRPNVDGRPFLARVSAGDQVLAAVLDPLDRPAELVRPAATTAISSRLTNIFCPNPPPTSPMITRTRCSGRPSMRAQTRRAHVRALRRPTRSSALRRGSPRRDEAAAAPSARRRSGAGTIVSLTTCAAAAKAASRSGSSATPASARRRSCRARGARG